MAEKKQPGMVRKQDGNWTHRRLRHMCVSERVRHVDGKYVCAESNCGAVRRPLGAAA